jgi:hypothetical protein
MNDCIAAKALKTSTSSLVLCVVSLVGLIDRIPLTSSVKTALYSCEPPNFCAHYCTQWCLFFWSCVLMHAILYFWRYTQFTLKFKRSRLAYTESNWVRVSTVLLSAQHTNQNRTIVAMLEQSDIALNKWHSSFSSTHTDCTNFSAFAIIFMLVSWLPSVPENLLF